MSRIPRDEPRIDVDVKDIKPGADVPTVVRCRSVERQMAIAEMFSFRYRVSPQPSSAAPPVGEQACSAVSLPLAGIRKQHLLLAFDALRCWCPRLTLPSIRQPWA